MAGIKGPAGRRDEARGERIRELRVKRGLTQAELGGDVGVTQRSVYEWERGGPISPGNLAVLCGRLDTAQDFVLAGKDDRPAPRKALDDRLNRLERMTRNLGHDAEAPEGHEVRIQSLEERVSTLEGALGRVVQTLEDLLLHAEQEPPRAPGAGQRRGSNERP